MKKIKKFKMYIGCLLASLLLISSINVVSLHAKTPEKGTILSQMEDSDSPDLTGGIITAISNSRFLSNLPAQSLYVGDSIDMLSGSISAVEEQNITIEKDGNSYTQTITVDWNEEVFDTSVAGSFDLVATILAPEGVTFAPGVLTHITIPITVMEKPEMIEITSITDYGTITSTNVIPVNDATTWEQTVQNWYDYYSYVWGVSDNDEGAEVVLESLDISQVDYTTPGDYTAVLYYQIADYLQDYYTLAEELQTVYIPVKVSDPSEFELIINHFDTIKFTGSYLYEPEETLEFLYIVTDQAVDTEVLDTISGAAVSETMGFASGHMFRIFVASLEENMHYYFFGKDGDTYSNYVHIYNDNTLPTYDYIEGDRDGGDSTNSELPDYNPDLNPILPSPSAEPTLTPTTEPTVEPTVEPTATPTAIPTATPLPTPEITMQPSDMVVIPTEKPIHLITRPQENIITTLNQSQMLDTIMQPDTSKKTNTTIQSTHSEQTDASAQQETSVNEDTTSQQEDSVNKDTSAQSDYKTDSADSDTDTDTATDVDTFISDINDAEEEKTIWMPLLIGITVLVLIVIVVELIIRLKRRNN